MSEKSNAVRLSTSPNVVAVAPEIAFRAVSLGLVPREIADRYGGEVVPYDEFLQDHPSIGFDKVVTIHGFQYRTD